MSAPQLQLRSGPSTTTQPSQTTTGTRIEVAGTLRLRGTSAEDRRIRWAEDVVDNEGMGRKSSKVCCIYHAPRAVGESSSESSSDSSSSDSDSELDNSTAKMSGKDKKRRQRRHDHDYDHDHGHDHDSAKGDEPENCSKVGEGSEAKAKGKGKEKGSRRKRSPNAYEKMPKVSSTPTVAQKL